MLTMNLKTLRMQALAGALFAVSVATLAPTVPAWAQGPGAVRGLPDFTELVGQVGRSVVNIRTLEKNRGGSPHGGAGDEDMQEFFRRFFGVPLPNVPRQGPRPNRPQEDEQPRGVGSGFILTGDGFIMTNAHVVDGADEVIVTLTDKREFKARRIGDSSRLKVGEWVMAIGSPFGLENSVTAGIVSAKQRDTGDYLPFIQTDVAINLGNSGGPLINMRGEVVGVNSQIYSRSGGYMGIAFAIPMDEAVRVSDQLRATGRVTRGRIGVQIDQVTKDIAESLGLGKAQGALVRGVESGSPAEKAGVEAGDIITRFDGKTVEKASDLPRFVGSVKPGTRTAFTVFRRGASKELSVVIGESEPEKVATRKPAEREEKARPSAAVQLLGLSVSELGDAQKKELKIKGGVKVDAATEGGARAGLREGDVITQVANQEVLSVRDFDAVVARLDKSKPVSVLFRRGEWAQYALIRPAR